MMSEKHQIKSTMASVRPIRLAARKRLLLVGIALSLGILETISDI
jgi:hypothetical protein